MVCSNIEARFRLATTAETGNDSVCTINRSFQRVLQNVASTCDHGTLVRDRLRVVSRRLRDGSGKTATCRLTPRKSGKYRFLFQRCRTPESPPCDRSGNSFGTSELQNH